MTPACIGWHTDPPCPAYPNYPEFHGCKLPDGHPGEHVCVCGQTTKNIRSRAGEIRRKRAEALTSIRPIFTMGSPHKNEPGRVDQTQPGLSEPTQEAPDA